MPKVKPEAGIDEVKAKVDLKDKATISSTAEEAKEAQSERSKLLDELLNLPDFKNITDEEAATMLGFFSKTMRSKGFPWEYKAVVNGKLKEIGDLEALFRLKRGETVYFFPKRVVTLNLTSSDLDKIGKVTSSKPIKDISQALKTGESVAKIDDPIGREVSDGNGIPVRNYAELKLLYQLFNPDSQIKLNEKQQKDKDLVKAVNTLKAFSKFVSEKFSSRYPWRFYSTSNSLVGKMANFFRAAKMKIIVGALLGAAFSGPLLVLAGLIGGAGLASMVGTGLLGATATGAAIGGAIGFKDGIREAKLGKEIGPIEGLKRLMRGQKVLFQQKKVHSAQFPVIGKVVWQTNYREPVTIKNPDELILLKDIYYGK